MSVVGVPPRSAVPPERTWDVASLFVTEDAWEAAYQQVADRLAALTAFRGRLGQRPEVLAAGFDASQDVTRMLGQVMVYASMCHAADKTDQVASARFDQARGLFARATTAGALCALHRRPRGPLAARPPRVPFAQAVHWICQGMAPLGEEYVSVLRRGVLQQRWVDRAPNRGKQSGAFSTGAPGMHPFILMSYSDDLYSMSTLAHELGHSIVFPLRLADPAHRLRPLSAGSGRGGLELHSGHGPRVPAGDLRRSRVPDRGDRGGDAQLLGALQRAGVDLASPEAVGETFEAFAGMVDRLERLLQHRASPRTS